jgi:phenylpropionate dioxygenase-like ring-hydroxylating dioxygenase large terminal subunit
MPVNLKPMEPYKPASILPEACRDAALIDDWHVVAASADIVAGQLVPLTLLERDLVGWRDTQGVVHVWEDLCIHRGARLSKGFIRDDKVICPYHGWNYDGSAQCVLMPAAPSEPPLKKARAIAHKTRENYGLVWVSLGAPEHDIPVFPEWEDERFKKVLCGPYKFKSGFRGREFRRSLALSVRACRRQRYSRGT